MLDKMKLGIIGCGNISGAYFEGARKTDALEIKACADIDMDAANKQADRFGCHSVSVDQLLDDSEIELVVNLTIPKAHAEIGLKALKANKHTYSEKPFAVDIDSGRELKETATRKKLRIGCAPDTFLGAGIQTARKQLDADAIGRPIAGSAFMCGHGHENWHSNPAFYYDIGGGPMMDMGPYYITALVNILGPIKRVAAVTTKAFEERIATSERAHGLRIPVYTTTHLTGVLEFVNETIITMIMSFDMWNHSLPCIELYGTDGSIKVPDPNGFGGSVQVAKARGNWEEVSLNFPHNARIIGLIDMVRAIRNDRPHRVSGDLAYHVLEVMLAFDKSSQTAQHVKIESTVERPVPLPVGLNEWEVED